MRARSISAVQRPTASPNREVLEQLREPLPSGWVHRCDLWFVSLLYCRWEARLTQSGQVYYANHVTRKTQWNRPTAEAAVSTTEVPLLEQQYVMPPSS